LTGLSEIERVDLRDIWPNEATDFTPWLGEHTSELGEALGLELEVQAQEAPVGRYSLDILAHDRASDRPVVIENQLETSNHDHLGKLLTYASGLDAGVVIWITREFREEHRQALDWLNQHTDEYTLFFGVAIELWKIDNSRPAPHFKIAAAPNDWRKVNVKPKMRPSPAQERYREFFQGLIDRLNQEDWFGPRSIPAGAKHFCTFPGGLPRRVHYSADFISREGKARMGVWIGGGDKAWNKQMFDRLLDESDTIESEFSEILGDGSKLDWRRMNRINRSCVLVERPGSIDDDETTLAEIREWMVKRLGAFRRVFTPRINELAE
jgi:hypothetical protein